jgi:hypothetical protein
MKFTLFCLFVITSSIFGFALRGQDRANSPYLACGADEARSAYASSRSIAEIQTSAALKCQSKLERNVDLSIAAIMKNATASGKPLPAKARSDLRPIIRPKLRNAFNAIIQNNVAALRQSNSQ